MKKKSRKSYCIVQHKNSYWMPEVSPRNRWRSRRRINENENNF